MSNVQYIQKPIDFNVWRGVVGYEGWYEVSKQGSVRNIKKRHSTSIGKLLHPKLGKTGYLSVRLFRDGNGKTIPIAQLVATAFIGPRPQGMVINHIDGNKSNNSVENLEYCTPSENTLHAIKMGLRSQPKGENHPRAKLTNDQVCQIRDLINQGKMSQRKIARIFGICPATITQIKNGKQWK